MFCRSFARRTEGYSNSDLLTLAREAAMGPIRELDKKQVIKAKPSQMRPVNAADFDMALTRVKPSSNDKIMDKLREFAARCGQLA
jgi:spastin